jgi:O-antigen ligase
VSRVQTLAERFALVFIFLIPWEGVITLSGGTTGAALFGFLLAALWLTLVVMRRRLRQPHPFMIAVYLFVLWNVASVFWSSNVQTTFSQATTWVQLFVFIYILWDLFRTRELVTAGLQAYVLGAYVAIGIAIFNFIGGNAFYETYQRFGPGGVNPDGFGFAIALAIPMAWYLGVRGGPLESNLLRFVNYFYIPAAFFGLALSGTRAALIAALPGMAYGLFSLAKMRLRARIAAFVLVAVGILALLPVVQPLRSFQRLGTTVSEINEGDLNMRVPIWQEGLDLLVDRPVLGVGAGAYSLVNDLDKEAHNSFLSVAVEVGLIGFVLFGFIVIIAATEAWDRLRFESGFWLTLILVWGIGASSLTWEDRRSTWLVLTLVVVAANLTNPKYGYRSPPPPELPSEIVRVGESS